MMPDMTEVTWTDQAAEFLAYAGDYLRARPAEHNVILTNAERRIDLTGTDDGWGWVASTDGAVAGAVMHTPPFGAYVSLAADDAIAALAGGVHERGRSLPGVAGFRQQAEAFAAEWRRRTGARLETTMRQGVYVADAVTPPSGVPGRMRRADTGDRELLGEWVADFHVDTGLPRDPASDIDERIAGGRMFVWVVDDIPVSMTGVTPPAVEVSRVQYVYTPDARRRHGYASACVAALTAEQLAQPGRSCMLYTDLANPTSNGIYQAVGYRRLGEAVQVAFR
jgi:predicted GNAT family acetyltransferase